MANGMEQRVNKTKGKVVTIVSLLIGATVVFAMLVRRGGNHNTITVDEAHALEADPTVVLLDVRTSEEFQSETGHLKNAVLIPIQDLEKRVAELMQYKGKTIIAYCRTGRRSGVAADLLTSKGYTALNMEGGIVKWNEEKLPVVKEEPR